MNPDAIPRHFRLDPSVRRAHRLDSTLDIFYSDERPDLLRRTQELRTPYLRALGWTGIGELDSDEYDARRDTIHLVKWKRDRGDILTSMRLTPIRSWNDSVSMRRLARSEHLAREGTAQLIEQLGEPPEAAWDLTRLVHPLVGVRVEQVLDAMAELIGMGLEAITDSHQMNSAGPGPYPADAGTDPAAPIPDPAAPVLGPAASGPEPAGPGPVPADPGANLADRQGDTIGQNTTDPAWVFVTTPEIKHALDRIGWPPLVVGRDRVLSTDRFETVLCVLRPQRAFAALVDSGRLPRSVDHVGRGRAFVQAIRTAQAGPFGSPRAPAGVPHWQGVDGREANFFRRIEARHSPRVAR